MREIALFFVLQFVSYLNITVDMRAVAKGQYLAAALTNMVAPVITLVMMRRAGKSNSPWHLVAVALGGAAAAVAGMWLTRWW